MIDGVERLRQAERVLREHRRFERADRLDDDLVQPRRFERQAPQRVAVVARLERVGGGRREARREVVLGDAVASGSLAKMFCARTTEYWR